MQREIYYLTYFTTVHSNKTFKFLTLKDFT